MTFSIILQILGALVIIAEVFIPSGGLLSVLATGLIGYSLYNFYTEALTQWLIVFALIDLVSIPTLIWYSFKALAKSPLTLKNRLSKDRGVVSQSPDLNILINKEGIATTDLRPSGIARIEGERYDVVTEGEYVEQDSEIVVLSITGNQIIVNPKIPD